STGISGPVSDANSLVGGSPGDLVGALQYDDQSFTTGDVDIMLLSNGNYLIGSPNWNGQRGAVTWGNGATGVSGTVSEANSLVGSNPGNYPRNNNPGDGVGFGNYAYAGVTRLTTCNYVVQSPSWNGTRGERTCVTVRPATSCG